MQISSSWVLQGQNGIESLKVVDKEIPRPGDHEVLVRIYAASLNHRELAIAKYAHTSSQSTLSRSQFLSERLLPDSVNTSTGIYVRLTAWNALLGLEGRGPKKGDAVLVQGTGGVSVIALQFALVCGATIIATTSSDSKAQKLQSLGAHHVLNYRTNPNWGETAKTLTPGQKGCDLVVDVGGLSTLNQSFKAVRPDGVISITGFKEMNRFVHQHQIRPVVDERVFGYEEAKEAYEYMMAQKHFSKVCVRIEEGSGN
ncbi:hypothetical protein AWENTII_003516 [Aspergillus wentii]